MVFFLIPKQFKIKKKAVIFHQLTKSDSAWIRLEKRHQVFKCYNHSQIWIESTVLLNKYGLIHMPQGCCWPVLSGGWRHDRDPIPMPADVIRAGQPARSCRGCICSWALLHQQSYSRLPAPSSFLTEVSQVLIILKHLQLPQMTLQRVKIFLSQRSEGCQNQQWQYTNTISYSNSFRVACFCINSTITTRKKKKANRKPKGSADSDAVRWV